jgi:carboxyl-terminal processing protease
MPDVFVPVDTVGATEYYNRVRSLGLMYRFAFHYTDIHRDALETFSTPEEIENYLDRQDLIPQFVSYAREKGVDPVTEEIRTSRMILDKTIKAYVARNLIDNDGFYPIIADIDHTLQVAIDTISKL